MASYHRVLDAFDRSVDQKSVECNYDIHPWDVLVDGIRWDGKIRLIGFVDIFFLICYSGESRFEKGIIIYKDDNAIRNILQQANVAAKDIGLDIVNEQELNVSKSKGQDPAPEKYFQLQSIKGGLDYTIISLGHEVGVKTRYKKTDLKKYEIKIRKGRDSAMKRRIRRGISQHDLFDLMHDSIRMGIITQAELIGFIIGKTVGGSIVEDVGVKYLSALTGAKSSKDIALAADRG